MQNPTVVAYLGFLRQSVSPWLKRYHFGVETGGVSDETRRKTLHTTVHDILVVRIFGLFREGGEGSESAGKLAKSSDLLAPRLMGKAAS